MFGIESAVDALLSVIARSVGDVAIPLITYMSLRGMKCRGNLVLNRA
jgi:hypothetical protein